ncbi:MAG: HEAT repeat domain-containing protein, partial [Nannocystaceae bacterium]
RLAREAPDNLEVQMQYGRGLRRAGRSGDAIRVLTPLAARIEGDRATPLAMLAELHVARGERDAAIDSAEQASAVTRGPEPLIRVSEALRQRGDLSAAQAALERAVNLFPERPGPLFELGMLAMTSGDLSAATTALTEALSKRGDDYIRKRAGAMALSLVVLTHREAEFLSALAQTATVDSSVSSRGLLAQTIELMDRDALRTWARRNPTLSEQVERQLLHAVRRDPLSTRAVAAETLGKLGAPNSGDTLVRVATRITTPPTISRTERRHLDRLRWEALLAAGALDDPRTFAPLMDAASKSRDPSVEIGATLALANSDHDASLEPLRALLLEDPRSEVKRALVCVGLARAAIRAGARLDAQLRPRIERSRTLARTSTATLSCEIANAVHTRDAQVARLLPLVSRDEQAVAEVAVWRLGRTAHPADHPEIGATLWRTFLASSGSLHAVARAALLRFYGEGTPNTLAPKVAAAPMPRLPLSITEWARDLLAHTEVRADWRRHATLAHAHLARALVSMEQGPRYERRAVTRWNEQCAIRNPPNRRASDSRTEHALLNCLVDGDEGQPRPEHTNASGPR